MESKLMCHLSPEEFPYQDKGCELSPACRDRQFPDRREEEPCGEERFLESRRAGRIMDFQREDQSTKEIARGFEVTPRTVQKWLKVVTHQKSRAGTGGQGG